MASSKQTRYFKMVLSGDMGVGKTSMRLRYLGQGFRKQYLSTLGADFSITKYNDDQLQIWDLAGQTNFRQMINSYFKGTHGLVIVFDVTRSETMMNIETWLEDFLKANEELVPTILVANKIDLREGDLETIDLGTIQQHVDGLSKKYDYQFSVVESSALSGHNIKIVFENLVDEILQLPE